VTSAAGASGVFSAVAAVVVGESSIARTAVGKARRKAAKAPRIRQREVYMKEGLQERG
jgi:hypothetical protein